MVSFAQEEENKVDKRPVRSPWETGLLLETPTTLVPKANTLDFVIQHRFGTLNSEEFDLIGLYAPSNIRIALSWGITDNINVGIGSNKFHKIQDGFVKWAILKQTRSNYMPVSLTYYGNFEMDARKDEFFGMEYTQLNRFSYFNSLMVSRKFNDKLSLQMNVSHAHFNQIDTSGMSDLKHDNLAVGVVGRYKVMENMGVIFNYQLPLLAAEGIQPVMGCGVEFGTSAHSFQLFVSNANAISYQNNMTYNQYAVKDGNILIGFNITRLYYF